MLQNSVPTAPSTATLQLRLFGHFQLLLQGKPVDGFHQARLQLLLAYVTLHRDRALPRQQIAFLFWPDSAEKQAFTNLRKLLYLLRQALPAADHFLSLTAETVTWRSDTAFTLDVADFEAAFQRGEASDSPVAKIAAYQEATGCYGGDLLPGFYDEWILVERERLRSVYANALTRLADLYESQRAYADALTCAQRLLSQDSLQESSHRLLMRLYLLNEDRAAALRVYHTCATLLREELGVDPSPATEEIYQRLLWLEDQPQTPIPALAATAAPLVGRDLEWNQLRALWQGARDGHPQLVLIEGEAGIGKTRLAEELFDTVKRQGMVAAYTRAYAAEGAAAYAPLVDLLRSGPIYAALGRLDTVWLNELSRLLPELAGATPHLPPPITEEWQRHRFQEALIQGCLAAGGPLLIHFDDLQWCDRETLAWLHFLLRIDQREKLLVVGTLRPGEIDAGHPLNRLRLELQRSDRCVSISLAPLSAADVVQLASHVNSRELSTEAHERLFVQTEGNPLFVIEMLRGENQPAVVRDGAYLALHPSPHPSLSSDLRTLPAKVQVVIEARLAQLTTPARQLARVAAVIGRNFTFDLLTDASDQKEQELVVGLDELWRRRIIREQGVDAYDFSHDRIREVAYGEISPMVRRHLHRRVAQALVERHPHEIDALSGQIAVHYDLAGDRANALHFNERAGVFAVSQFAHADAIHFLTRALALAPLDDLQRRFNLLARREECQAALAQPESRLADLTEMKELAQRLFTQNADAKPLIVTLTRQGAYLSDAGQAEPAIAHLQQAIALARDAGEHTLEIEAHSILGAGYFMHGRLDAARNELLLALGGAIDAVPSAIIGRAYEYMAAVSMFSGALAEVIAGYLEKALFHYSAIHDKDGEASILNKLGYLLVAQGEGEDVQAEEYYRKGMDLGREMGHRPLESLISRNLGALFTYTGAYTQAEQAFQHSLKIDRQSKLIQFEGAALNYLAFLALNMGDYARAQALNRAAHEKLAASEARGWLSKMWSELGLLHHIAGDQDAALECLTRGLEMAEDLGDRRQIGSALTRFGYTLTALGRFDEATAALQKAFQLHCALQQTNRSIYPLAGLAKLAHLQGELPRAQQIVEQIFEHLATRCLDATDEALQVYLTCFEILQAAGDPRSATVFQMAREQLQRRVATIADDAVRKIFWSAPLHRLAAG
jgi:DNA-binding SARP family transcriptional activator/tetratricopeptide (TPR) repeat protein